MAILRFSAITAALAARYPKANFGQGGTIDSLQAAGGEVSSISAAASVRGFSASVGNLEWVKATDNFFEAGSMISVGDYVQVKEGVAKWLESQGRAVIVDEAEVQSAAAKSTTKAKS